MQPREAEALPQVVGGDIALDPATRTVMKDESPIDLTTVEFELLHLLLSTAASFRGEDISQPHIVVREHGPGVPPEEIDRIFLPFHRVGASRDRNSSGIGLGLSIAARAAGVHGGTIRTRNADGGGLEVAIDLPLYKALHSLAVS